MKPGVLIVVATLGERGGAQLRWRRIARALSGERTVTLLTWAPGRPRVSSLDGARVLQMPCIVAWDRDRGAAVEAVNAAVSLVTGVGAALWSWRRWRVAIGAGLHPETAVAGVAAAVLRRPFLGDVWLVGPHGNVARLESSRLRAPLVRLLCRARGILAATDVAARELAAAGIRPGHVELNKPYIDATRVSPASPAERAAARAALAGVDGPRVVAYAGRFDLRQKLLLLLVDAWNAARPAGWQLVLVGDGPDAVRVDEAVSASAGIVRLTWRDDVSSVLAAADAFVLPTRFENPGYAVFEGMAMALPGIVSDIDVYRELEPDGVERAPNTAEAWTAALARLASWDDDERGRRGRAARRWVERHTVGSADAHLGYLLDA